MMTLSKKTKGFNLVEALVASVILSGSVLTLAAISTQAVSGLRLNRQYEIAASLADRQLSLIDYMGIDEFIEQGEFEGIFQEYEPDYHWKVVTKDLDIDSLYLVSITVSWVERNRPYSITIDTMLDGTTAILSTEQEQM
jgi:Tfp pilus assembly protein PilV